MTAPENEKVSVCVTHRFTASAQRVFDAWLDPQLICRWMFGPALRDEEVLRIAVEVRIGGPFSFVVRRQGQEIDHLGEYLAIERPSRLVFTWTTRDNLPDTSQVTIRIQPSGTGCELTLTHEMNAQWADYTDGVQASWAKMIGVLDATLADDDHA